MNLNRVILFSPRPRALADFYCDAFGLQILAIEGTFVDVGTPGSPSTRIGFHKGTRTPGASVKLCFHTPEVAAERERLIGLGVQMGKLHGSAESLCFCDGTDAEGNLLQITNRA